MTLERDKYNDKIILIRKPTRCVSDNSQPRYSFCNVPEFLGRASRSASSLLRATEKMRLNKDSQFEIPWSVQI